MTQLVSVVVPVYNEAEGIAQFHERATAALASMNDCDYELIYVDDGSRDGSYEIMHTFAGGDKHVRVVKFSRNFGHQIAITAGLDHARGDAIVFIDADLQDPPELIKDLIAKWREGYDVVYARRAVRKGETWFKLFTAAAFYQILRSLANIDIPPDVGDFRIISARVADQLRGMREKDRFIRGLISWVGFRQSFILYERDERYAGETKFSLAKMVRFAIDGITSFSVAPLRIASWMGYASSVLAFIYLLSVFIQVALGMTVEGWATIVVAVLFLGGVQLICLGILGEYLGRVFMEVKTRPIYIIEEITGDLEPAIATFERQKLTTMDATDAVRAR